MPDERPPPSSWPYRPERVGRYDEPPDLEGDEFLRARRPPFGWRDDE